MNTNLCYEYICNTPAALSRTPITIVELGGRGVERIISGNSTGDLLGDSDFIGLSGN